jgi:hypothetical protein
MCRRSTVLVRNNRGALSHEFDGVSLQAGRFAIMEVHLLSFVKNDANFDKSVGNSAKHALSMFTYLALFFCLGAVVSGNILTYGLGGLPMPASQEMGPSQSNRVKRTWVWVMWHCEHLVFSIEPVFFLTTDRRGVLPHSWHRLINHTGALIRVAGRAKLC